MKAKLKRFLSSLLVAALLLQMAPFEALATDSAATADQPVVSSEPDESTEAAQPDGEFSYADDASPPETYIEGEVMEARDEYEKHLSGAREEAAALVRSAAQTAKSRSEQILLDAKEEAASIRAKASGDIAQERRNAVNEIKNDISGIAVSIASKVVEKEIDEKDHEKLIQEFIDQMGEAV